MKAVESFETSATLYQSTQCNISEDLNFHRQRDANFSVSLCWPCQCLLLPKAGPSLANVVPHASYCRHTGTPAWPTRKSLTVISTTRI